MNAMLALFVGRLRRANAGSWSLARTRRGGDSRRNTTIGQRTATLYHDRKRIWVLVGDAALRMPVLRQTILEPSMQLKIGLG